MSHWIRNDGGRAAYGYTGKAGDCVTRSIAIVTNIPYSKVYSDMAWINATMPKTKGRRTAGLHSAFYGIYTTSVLFKRYMESLNFIWTPTMFIGSGCRVHLRANELPSGGLVVSVSKHLTAVIDGVIHDTHDPSRGGRRCVYGYWKLERLQW
jgi:hypothetical protein